MAKILDLASNLVGGAGLVLCLTAGGLRVAGQVNAAGFEAMTLFNVGVAGMVLACLIKLQRLSTD